MKNLLLLLFLSAIIGIALLKGTTIEGPPAQQKKVQTPVPSPVPHIGRVQVLNGCGIRGAAQRTAEFLRLHDFDVKNTDNADNWNFSETLIISRTTDTTVAVQIAAALSSKNMVLIRNQETRYDVTVIIGNDYRERIQ